MQIVQVPNKYNWSHFAAYFTGFSILIWFGAALCIIAYTIESSTKSNPSADNLYLGCVLIAVDVICGLFSFYQNFKSTKVFLSYFATFKIGKN